VLGQQGEGSADKQPDDGTDSSHEQRGKSVGAACKDGRTDKLTSVHSHRAQRVEAGAHRRKLVVDKTNLGVGAKRCRGARRRRRGDSLGECELRLEYAGAVTCSLERRVKLGCPLLAAKS